ncbi:MAG: hypothetical protein DCC68_20745 [Planctomycetota bacterium]|nr:MAG: hypothetical protein DCC68_20745 [Planctomycetota bacterium]
MAFVVGVDGPDGFVLFFYDVGDLLGFEEGDAGVVLAVDDEERRADLAGVGRGVDAFERGAHGGVAFVAVFGSAEVAAVGGGFFEKRDEVGDADDVRAGAEAVGEVRERGEDHIAAVGAAFDGDALGV